MESIKQEIEEFVGKKIAEIIEVEVCEYEWAKHNHKVHVSEVDGSECWDSQVNEWSEEGDAEIVVVIQTPNKPILLRQVAVKDENGNAYHELDAWLPENAFGKGIWSEKEKVEMLRARFYDTWEDKLKLVGVRYEEE